MAQHPPPTTTVTIIGGGPVGLVSSILLSLQGIDHVLFERQPGTSIHPKAVGLNQRTMEIFRQIGVEDEVLRQGAPVSSMQKTAWFTSLGPDGREIARRDAWGGGPYAKSYAQASPCRYTNLPQIRLEPILRKRAEELNPNGIFYYHEVDLVSEDDERVTTTYHNRANETSEHITSTYALGCDGGRFLADSLGIEFTGESNILDMVTAHVRAPLSQYRDMKHFISWFTSPELGGSIKTGYLYHLGPYPVKPETEEWMFACARLPHEQEQPFTEKDMLDRLHRTLGLPDLPVELLSISHWYVNAKVASRYRSTGGHVFLVGDAAHRVPPWGALGLNTGVQDAQNLIWKLVLALRLSDVDFTGLLNSYDTERRPIGERVAKTSLHNLRAHALVLDHAVGIAPEKTTAENVKAMKEYFDLSNQDAGSAKRHEVQKALKTLDLEFYAHGAEVGWFYDMPDAVLPPSSPTCSPQLKHDETMELCEYHACALPGHQLPHAWLTVKDNKRVSTRELAKQDRLVLLASSPAWQPFAHKLMDVHVISSHDGSYQNTDGKWVEQSGVSGNGAVLVRPDNIIGFRFDDDSIFSSADSETTMNKVVDHVFRLAPHFRRI